MSKREFEQTYPMTIDSTDVPVLCTYNYTAGRPGRMYLSNGDPGYPDEPAEIDILKMEVQREKDGVPKLEPIPQWLEDIISEQAYEWLMEHHNGDE